MVHRRQAGAAGSKSPRLARVSTTKRELAVSLALTGKSAHHIAAQLGVAQRTVREWLNEPDNKERLQLETSRAIESAVRELDFSAVRVTSRLLELVDSADPHVALAATKEALNRIYGKPIERHVNAPVGTTPQNALATPRAHLLALL